MTELATIDEHGEIVPIRPLEEYPLGRINSTAMIQQATDVANNLADIIQSKGLYTMISGKRYVQVEGWTTLGALLGIIPVELSVVRGEDGGYEAQVELRRTSDGGVMGRASAIVGMDEKTWSRRDEYARRSMAVTRATSKAFRLGFSWIMVLAGYAATPWEEMPERTDLSPSPKPPSGPRKPATATPTDAPPKPLHAILGRLAELWTTMETRAGQQKLWTLEMAWEAAQRRAAKTGVDPDLAYLGVLEAETRAKLDGEG